MGNETKKVQGLRKAGDHRVQILNTSPGEADESLRPVPPRRHHGYQQVEVAQGDQMKKKQCVLCEWRQANICDVCIANALFKLLSDFDHGIHESLSQRAAEKQKKPADRG
jgi:hypothetical protein